MNTATIAPVLEITRLIDASRDRVFAAWTDKEKLQSWYGPEGCRSEVTLFEPRVSGRYRVVMHLPDGRDVVVGGVFRAIEPPHRIVMTSKWEHGTVNSQVTVTFREASGKTELTLRHEGFETQSDCDAHKLGWSSSLNDLEKYLAGRL